MTTYELWAYGTDSRHGHDTRYRAYTTSLKKAEAFRKIPKIPFTDSGHGIVFSVREVKSGEKRKPTCHVLAEYVAEHMPKPAPKREPVFASWKGRAQAAEEALTGLVEIIDKAGLVNLANGVKTWRAEWQTKATDRLGYARRVLVEAGQ